MSFVGPSVQNAKDQADPPSIKRRESGFVQCVQNNISYALRLLSNTVKKSSKSTRNTTEAAIQFRSPFPPTL